MQDEVSAMSASPAVPHRSTLATATAAEEQALVALARQNRVHFTRLYRRYVTPVYWYFYQQCGTVQDAEDLTATTFSQALVSLDRYQEQGRFAAWLFSIARHTLLTHRRGRAWLGEELTPDHLMAAEQEPEAVALSHDELRRLQHLIQQLPPDQREALSLRFLAELRTAEVAHVLGRSEGAVKMLVQRAVMSLRERLRQEDGT